MGMQSVDDAAHQPPLFKRHVSTCNKVVDAEISGFAEAVSSCVAGHYKESHRRGSYSLPLFVKAALAWLRSNEYTAQLSDKDGVFELASRCMFDHLRWEQV